jgi:hypothetical protein
MGSGGIAPHIFNIALGGGVWSASCPSCFTPREKPLLPNGEEAGWASRAGTDMVAKRKIFDGN